MRAFSAFVIATILSCSVFALDLPECGTTYPATANQLKVLRTLHAAQVELHQKVLALQNRTDGLMKRVRLNDLSTAEYNDEVASIVSVREELRSENQQLGERVRCITEALKTSDGLISQQ